MRRVARGCRRLARAWCRRRSGRLVGGLPRGRGHSLHGADGRHRPYSQLPRSVARGRSARVRPGPPRRAAHAGGCGGRVGSGEWPRGLGFGPRPARARRHRRGSSACGAAAAAPRCRRLGNWLRARREPPAPGAARRRLGRQSGYRAPPALAVGRRRRRPRACGARAVRAPGPAGRGRAGAGGVAARRRRHPWAGSGRHARRREPLAAVVAARGMGRGHFRHLCDQPPHRARRDPVPLRPRHPRAHPCRSGLPLALDTPPRGRRPRRRGRGPLVPRSRGPGEDLARPGACGEGLAGAAAGAGSFDAGACRCAQRLREPPVRRPAGPRVGGTRGRQPGLERAHSRRSPPLPGRGRPRPAAGLGTLTSSVARDAAGRRLPGPAAAGRRDVEGGRSRRLRRLPALRSSLRREAAGARRGGLGGNAGWRPRLRGRARPQRVDRVALAARHRAGHGHRRPRHPAAPALGPRSRH